MKKKEEKQEVYTRSDFDKKSSAELFGFYMAMKLDPIPFPHCEDFTKIYISWLKKSRRSTIEFLTRQKINK